VNIGDFITVTDEHHPLVEEKILSEPVEIDQRRGEVQFFQPAQHCFGQAILNHEFLVIRAALMPATACP